LRLGYTKMEVAGSSGPDLGSASLMSRSSSVVLLRLARSKIRAQDNKTSQTRKGAASKRKGNVMARKTTSNTP
jgi:hypothetical protein